MRYYDLRGDALMKIEESIKRRYGRSYDRLNMTEKSQVDAALASMSETRQHGQSAPQRQTRSLSESWDEQDYQDYGGNPFRGKLHPKNWKALANRAVPWPQDAPPPEEALAEFAQVLEFQILQNMQASRGRDLRQMIKMGEIS